MLRRLQTLRMFILPDDTGLYQRVYPAELWFTEKKDRKDFEKWINGEGGEAFAEYQRRKDGDEGKH